MRWELAAATATALLLLAHALTLRSYPLVFVDEPSLSSVLWSVSKGLPELNILRAWYGDMPELGSGPDTLVLRLAFEHLGLGYVAGRAASLSWGVLLVAETFLLATLLLGRKIGWLAGLVLLTSWPFLYSSHLIRQDIVVAALGTGAVLIQQWALRRRMPWLHLLLGPLVFAAYLAHPNVVMFALLLGLLYVHAYGTRVFRATGAWMFALGLLGAAISHLGVQVLRGFSPSLVGPSAQFLLASAKTPPLFAYPPQEMLLTEWLRYAQLIRTSPLELLLLSVGLTWTVGHREKGTLPLLISVAAISVCFLLLIQNKSLYYLILLYPFVCILFASALRGIAYSQVRFDSLRVFAILATCWVVGCVAWRAGVDVLPLRNYDYEQAMLPLRQAIPEGASVVAEPTYWFALTDHPYINAWALSWLYQRDGTRPQDFMREHRPDYLILDPIFAGYFNRTNPFAGTIWERYYRFYHHFPLPGDVQDLFGPNAEVEAKLQLPYHGEVWVVRAGWE